MSAVRSVSRKRIHIIVYIADVQYQNCINTVRNGNIICKSTNHIVYPINRLRNLGLRNINGFVLDLDADIIPQSIQTVIILNCRKYIPTSTKTD